MTISGHPASLTKYYLEICRILLNWKMVSHIFIQVRSSSPIITYSSRLPQCNINLPRGERTGEKTPKWSLAILWQIISSEEYWCKNFHSWVVVALSTYMSLLDRPTSYIQQQQKRKIVRNSRPAGPSSTSIFQSQILLNSMHFHQSATNITCLQIPLWSAKIFPGAPI